MQHDDKEVFKKTFFLIKVKLFIISVQLRRVLFLVSCHAVYFLRIDTCVQCCRTHNVQKRHYSPKAELLSLRSELKP